MGEPFRMLEMVKVIGESVSATNHVRLTGETGIVLDWSDDDGHRFYGVHFNTFGESMWVAEENLQSLGALAEFKDIASRSRAHRKRKQDAIGKGTSLPLPSKRVSHIREKSTRQRSEQICLRAFVNLADHKEAASIGRRIGEQVSALARIMRLETEPYWKIPEWCEIFVIFELVAGRQPAAVFQEMLSLLGKGWQGAGAGKEGHQSAIWKAGAGNFHFPHVQWAHVELG